MFGLNISTAEATCTHLTSGDAKTYMRVTHGEGWVWKSYRTTKDWAGRRLKVWDFEKNGDGKSAVSTDVRATLCDGKKYKKSEYDITK